MKHPCRAQAGAVGTTICGHLPLLTALGRRRQTPPLRCTLACLPLCGSHIVTETLLQRLRHVDRGFESCVYWQMLVPWKSYAELRH